MHACEHLADTKVLERPIFLCSYLSHCLGSYLERWLKVKTGILDTSLYRAQVLHRDKSKTITRVITIVTFNLKGFTRTPQTI